MSEENVVDFNQNSEEEEQREILPYEQEFIKLIDYVDEYCQNKSEMGGLDTGFPQMTECMDGIQSGLTLVAGQPNSGKTSICLQLASQIASNNENVLVAYHSLDDSSRDVIPRIVSCMESIPINSVKLPERYRHSEFGPDFLYRRNRGLERLKGMANKLIVRDETYNGDGSDIDVVEQSIKELLVETDGTDKEIVLIIDNFHDLTTKEMGRGVSGNEKYDYIADRLTTMVNQYNIPIICTAELRKLNGFRRPTQDDVRETTKIAYEADLIMLCYNEVGLKGENANVYFENTDTAEKQPVLEVHFGKNKLSSFKGRLFYNFFTEMSYLQEVPPEGARLLKSAMGG